MKKIWIDYLRVIATIAVIVTHVSSGFLHETNFEFTNWWIGLFSAGSMRFCVPIFVMISGVLLLPKQYALKVHLQKRFQRILLPFLFWSIIYILIDLILPILKGEPIIIIDSLKHFFYGLIFGVRGHLWYIYMILGLYLFIPFIQKWILQYEKNEMYLFLSLWTLTLIINWFIPSVPGEKGYNFGRGIDLTYFVSQPTGDFTRNFVRYLTPNVALVSIGIFLLFKNNCNKTIPQRHINYGFQTISKYSYGVYLSHIFSLGILGYLGISKHFINPIIGILTTTFLCLIMSLIITIIINKLPLGKYVSG
jgi:surface polysaccharide O-acyltransferase-like enzyme